MINADDWLALDVVETAVTKMARMGELAIVHGVCQLWKAGEKDLLRSGRQDYLNRDMTINHATVFASRECYQRFGLFRLDFRIAMDYEWLLRMRSSGVEINCSPNLLANMSMGGVTDRNYHLQRFEVVRAKMLHVGKIRALTYYGAGYLKTTARWVLEQVGLRSIVNYCHRHFSASKRALRPPPPGDS